MFNNNNNYYTFEHVSFKYDKSIIWIMLHRCQVPIVRSTQVLFTQALRQQTKLAYWQVLFQFKSENHVKIEKSSLFVFSISNSSWRCRL